ncbi:condensation domain-containing protein [[Clostridium] polysaccharolyticum]|uniref:Condensation domain-containing protein n=1 Tax=[Clostridium] polysaccharolyticum TaxID=29364 RepID=A0A1I0AFV0_9FIRM|nr:condensation domain-containing protein [[Clostridium] polysaccharolyticum]SES92700.1 Condensation domain-containing protein [[Clostridium] polysaccharolyticum]
METDRKKSNGIFQYPLSDLANTIMKTDMDYEKEPDGMWNLCIALKLTGMVDIEKVKSSMQSIVKENDALHSNICKVRNSYYIKILDTYHFEVQIEQADSMEAARQKCSEYAAIHIDVFHNLPIEATLFCINSAENLLFIKTHHVISDATSLLLIKKGFQTHYFNQMKDITGTHGSYKNFMEAEIEFAQSDKAKKQEIYWEEECKNYKPIVFPVDYSKKNGFSHFLSRYTLDAKELQRVAKQEKTSVFNVVLTIIQMAFAKVNHVWDSMIYYLYENRMDKEYMETIGCLTRAIPNRYQFQKDETIGSIHKKMRSCIAKGFNNRDKSMKYGYFLSDYVISYQTIKGQEQESVSSAMELSPVFVVRRFEWMFLMITETEDTISVFHVCDLRKFGPDYLECLKNASLEAADFICNNPEQSFGDYMESKKHEEEDIILI